MEKTSLKRWKLRQQHVLRPYDVMTLWLSDSTGQHTSTLGGQSQLTAVVERAAVLLASAAPPRFFSMKREHTRTQPAHELARTLPPNTPSTHAASQPGVCLTAIRAGWERCRRKTVSVAVAVHTELCASARSSSSSSCSGNSSSGTTVEVTLLFSEVQGLAPSAGGGSLMQEKIQQMCEYEKKNCDWLTTLKEQIVCTGKYVNIG